MIHPPSPTFDAPARARRQALSRLVLASLLVVVPASFMARAATSPAPLAPAPVATKPVEVKGSAAKPAETQAPAKLAEPKVDHKKSAAVIPPALPMPKALAPAEEVEMKEEGTDAAKAPATLHATAAKAGPVAAPAKASRAVKPAALSPKEAQGLVTLGNSLTDRGDFGAAEIAFRQILAGNAPEEPTKSALLGLAHMHRKQGALTKAAAIYQRYVKDYPNDDRIPDALLELGRTLRDMGAPKMAIAAFYNVINSTLKLPSGSGFDHYQLLAKTAQFEVAETHFQAGEFAEATKFFSRLRMLDLAPQDRARAHFKAGYSLELSGDLEGAVTTLRSFLEQWPEDENVPETRFLLATSLRRLNRGKEALAVTLDLLNAEHARSSPDAKRWAYWQRKTGNQLANDFFQSGDIGNALAIYQSLVNLSDDPNWRMPVLYQVALCYERLSDHDHSIATYRTLVEAGQKDPSPVVADIARMAASRLAHVDWRDATDRQVAELFNSTTGQTKVMPVTPKTVPSHDDNRSATTAPPAL